MSVQLQVQKRIVQRPVNVSSCAQFATHITDLGLHSSIGNSRVPTCISLAAPELVVWTHTAQWNSIPNCCGQMDRNAQNLQTRSSTRKAQHLYIGGMHWTRCFTGQLFCVTSSLWVCRPTLQFPWSPTAGLIMSHFVKRVVSIGLQNCGDWWRQALLWPCT